MRSPASRPRRARTSRPRGPLAPAWAGALLGLCGLGLGLGLAGCSEPVAPKEPVTVPEVTPAPAAEDEGVCPAKAEAPDPLPGIRPELQEVDYWLRRTTEQGLDLDAPVLSPAALAEHNAVMVRADAGSLRHDLLGPVDPAAILELVNSRLAFVRGKITEGKYLRSDGSAPGPEEVAALDQVAELPPLRPEVRVALAPVPVYCAPRSEGLFTASLDPAFDRNLCSVLRPQEPLQILMAWSDELLLARSGYVLGWIPRGAALSPALARADQEAFVRGPWMTAIRDVELRAPGGEVIRLPFASRAPIDRGHGRGAVRVASERGVIEAAAADADALAPTNRPLTRRAFLEDAFRYLGRSYGWGGYREGRDCSRFLMDLFADFGVDLPRHSSDQALAGEVIDLAPGLPEADRMAAIDRAHRRGLVLLHFPNHIMLYLGRDAEGVPRALHSFAEYLVPCAGRTPEMPAGEREILYTVDRILVSDLELGRGSSRTAFIERITRI
ncbi:MAG: C40 family peptidase, partial [Myxococcales bacterium]|nr:C40 family peptidase [Myxococcales bacterium]